MGEKKFLDEVTAFSLYDITGGGGCIFTDHQTNKLYKSTS